MGVDVHKFLDRTEEMVHACAASVPVEENPGVVLGTILGLAAARFGRDKLTIIASPGIRDLGGWLEQLLAESTGKDGKGIIPVDSEEPGPPAVYGGGRPLGLPPLGGGGGPRPAAAGVGPGSDRGPGRWPSA